MKKLLSIASLLVAGALGCGETEDRIDPQKNLDRPTSITFACHGNLRLTNGAEPTLDTPVVTSAMPTSACDIRSGPPLILKPPQCQTKPSAENPMPAPVFEPPAPPGQGDFYADGEVCQTLNSPLTVNWKGFVLQSGPGTVAIASFSTGPAAALGNSTTVGIDDADLLTPGKNSISVGEDPIAITTDRAGCHVITANAGSCDLSVLDINSALEQDAKVDRRTVKNASGTEIRARPAAMVAEPSLTEIGNVCPATPTGLVYVAYPSCHLVAGVDSATGTIVTGVQYDAAGVPSIVGGDVTCPDECSGDSPTPGIRPVTLDLELDPRTMTHRLVIGSENSRSIAVVELDDMARPLSLFQVALEDPRGDLGVTALALSPQMGMGGKGESITDMNTTGGQFQFVYAVATDNTVRVVDVLDVRTECDTQVDPRFARSVSLVRRLSCFPVGDPATPPRRPGAVGPGIALPGGDIPLSVDFMRQELTQPTLLVGYFATISASSGQTYIANVDDDGYSDLFIPTSPLAVLPPLAMAHQLRDGGIARERTPDSIEEASKDDQGNVTVPINCDITGQVSNNEAINGPHIITAPVRNVPPGSVATEKLTQLPGFRQLLCNRHDTMKAVSEMAFVAPDAARDRSFPDLAALAPTETWSFAWEGLLSNNRGDTDVGGPAVRESMLFVDGAGMHLRDQTKPFCDAGVEPFDIVQLRGCDPSVGNAHCPSGYTCFVHPESQVQGLGACMRSDEADRLANLCKDFLTTSRRYTVKTTESGELLLTPRRFELRTTPLDGCVDDNQCQTLANYALRAGRSAHPVDDTTAPDTHKWGCVADPTRAPMGGTGKRCEMRCNASTDCVAGTICAGAVAGQDMSGFCMEGVTPPQSCVNAPQRYELRAGEAFAVLGSRSGLVHPIIADTNGTCIKDPAASPLLLGRLPLAPKDRFAPNTLHPCDPMADPITGKLPNGMFEPNPCSTTVAHTDVKPRYAAGTCTLQRDPQGDPITDFVERQAPAVRFRNRGMTLTLVDPYYPGDAMCITDRGANLGQIPHVVPGYVLSFRQEAGFKPVVMPSRATIPTRVVRGPVNTIWVIDQGDFLSTTPGISSTLGSVFVFDALRLAGLLQ
jgi:hypothetical protein